MNFWYHLNASPLVLKHSGLRFPLSLMILIGLCPWYPGNLTTWFSTIFYLIMVCLVVNPLDWSTHLSLKSTYGMNPLYPGIWDVTLVEPTESSFNLFSYLADSPFRIFLGLCPNCPKESANSLYHLPLVELYAWRLIDQSGRLDLSFSWSWTGSITAL